MEQTVIKLDNIKYEKTQPKYYYTLTDNKHKTNNEDAHFKSKLLISFLEKVRNMDKNKIISGNESDE